MTTRNRRRNGLRAVSPAPESHATPTARPDPMPGLIAARIAASERVDAAADALADAIDEHVRISAELQATAAAHGDESYRYDPERVIVPTVQRALTSTGAYAFGVGPLSHHRRAADVDREWLPTQEVEQG